MGKASDQNQESGNRLAASLQIQIGMSVGEFKLLKELGSGAFGVVYQAFDTELHRDVALKFPRFVPDVDSPQWKRFIIEARAAARLQHPNICAVHQVVTDPCQPYIVMHYVQGESLKSVLRRRRRFPPADAANFLSKVAAALAYAHENGVIHRDLKPDNILICEDGEPILTDFGMARIGGSDTNLTAVGDILGTPAYMSPEQGKGRPEEIGPATDIYSIGVLMYEMLCGRLPFQGTAFELISQIANVQPQPPSAVFAKVNSALEAVCLKAMAKRIEDRYASMTDLQSAIEQYPQPGTAASVVEMSGGPANTETVDGPRVTTIYRENETTPPMTRSPEETPTFIKPHADVTITSPPAAVTKRISSRTLFGGGLASAVIVAVSLFLIFRKSERGPASPSQTELIATAVKELRSAFITDGVVARKKTVEPKAITPLEQFHFRGKLKDVRDRILQLQKAGDEQGESKLLLSFSNKLIDAGEFDAAYTVARRMVLLAGNDPAKAPFAHGQLGRVLMKRGDPVSAIQSFEREQKDLRGLYNKMMRFPPNKKVRELQSHMARLLSLNLNRVGNANKMLKRYKKAEQAYQEALLVLKPHDDRKKDKILVLMNYGSLLSIRGDHKEAVKTLNQSYNLAKSIGDSRSQAEISVNLGNTYSRAGNNKQALKTYQQAEQRLGKNPPYHLQTTLLLNWILASAESGKFDAARSHLWQLRKVARKNDRQIQSFLKRIGPLLQEN